MRIIKLSKAEFGTHDDVRRFFVEVLPGREPEGQFRVTPGHIAKDGLSTGEPLIFTYQARVVYTAQAKSSLVPNHDDTSSKYPNYFVVDLATLLKADVDFHEIEDHYNKVTGSHINLVHSQGWNRLPDSVYTAQIWTRLRFTLADEIMDSGELFEGKAVQIMVNAYERNPKARQQCIEHYGTSCSVCDFNFSATYGDVADGFIHVHHLRALSDIGSAYVVKPVEDLRPVCPNCHAVLHLRKPPYSIEEIRAILHKLS